MPLPRIHILDRIRNTLHYHNSKCSRQPRMCEPQQDAHDGTLGVDDESHDGGEPERDDALPVQDDDGDALVLDGGDGVPEQVHDDDGEAQVPDHDDALQVLELDDGLVYDAQDVVRALLLQVPLDDVHHHEQVLPHDYHLCSLVLPTHVHHDYCVQVLMYAEVLRLHYVCAVRKLLLT